MEKLIRGQHSDFIDAQFLALEKDLRDLLRCFHEWQEFERAAAVAPILPPEMAFKFEELQKSVVNALAQETELVASEVPKRLIALSKPETRGSAYDLAASFTNVISRICKKVIDKIASGSLEGIKDGTKKFVSGIMLAGSGAVLLWFITTYFENFRWLRPLWEFTKKALNL